MPCCIETFFLWVKALPENLRPFTVMSFRPENSALILKAFSARSTISSCSLFESAVDLLSFATLLKLYGKPWNADHLVSLAGVYKPKQEIRDSSLPLALSQYLSDHPNIRTVHLCLDNDMGGRLAADTLKLLLPERYGVEVKERFPPRGKDYNDYLCDLLGLQRTTRKAKENTTNERV